jgi:hypothetical protein
MLAAEGETSFIKCLNSHPYVLFYSKIIDFYRIKTNTKLDNVSLVKANIL